MLTGLVKPGRTLCGKQESKMKIEKCKLEIGKIAEEFSLWAVGFSGFPHSTIPSFQTFHD
jgi:hypothetical protein